ADIGAAREIAHCFLKDERWELSEEKEAYLITPEKIDGVDLQIMQTSFV
ncbi:MAG: hypothetical protein GY777_10430, partial [Candidatus Brocadiaceae bacterium]|nr:hypothetical protein [Candidatus Brocadiaceae bacterium]